MGIVMTDSVDLYPDCVTKYNSREKCVFPQYYLDLIKAPLFVIESEYDQWSLSFIVGTMCQNLNLSLKSCNSFSMNRIEAYRTSFMNIINPMVPLRPNWGYWIIACVKHVFDQSESFNSGDYEVAMDSGWTLSDALNQWLENLSGSNVHIDSVQWPNNEKCASTKETNVDYFAQLMNHQEIGLPAFKITPSGSRSMNH